MQKLLYALAFVALTAAGVAVGVVIYQVGWNRGHHEGFVLGIQEGIQSERNRISRETGIEFAECAICRGTGFLYECGPGVLSNIGDESTKVKCPTCNGSGRSSVEVPKNFEPMTVLRLLRRHSKPILKHLLNGTSPTEDEFMAFMGAVQAANSVPAIDKE